LLPEYTYEEIILRGKCTIPLLLCVVSKSFNSVEQKKRAAAAEIKRMEKPFEDDLKIDN